jgi:hypothetical protein
LKAPVDPWGWIVEERPARHHKEVEIDYNLNGLDSKPSFYEMVRRALLHNKLHNLRGVGLNNIYKFVAANWPVDLDTYRRLTRAAIKRAIDEGKIEVVEGPSVAYRLVQAERGNGAGKKQKNGDDASKPKTRKAANNGVVATKRGVVGGGKASKKQEDSDSEEEAPRKPTKKSAKKAGKNRMDEDVHFEQQPGQGKWVWQYQDGGWHDYDPAGSDEVEQTYQLYEKEKATGRVIDVRAVRSGSWEYQVDFRQFTQTNIRHEAHTVRSIRRIWRPA